MPLILNLSIRGGRESGQPYASSPKVLVVIFQCLEPCKSLSYTGYEAAGWVIQDVRQPGGLYRM